MDKAYLWYNYYLVRELNYGNYDAYDDNGWGTELSTEGTILYSVVTPLICFFGICGNFISLLVLLRKEMKASVFTYLSVLAATDLAKCAGLFLSGISRGLFWSNRSVVAMDAFVAVPVGSAVSALSTMATVAVACDRVVYLWNPCVGKKPKYSTRKAARKIMSVGALVSVILSLPYWFIYKLGHEGAIENTAFFYSLYYCYYNWIVFVLLGAIPALILITANTMLIMSVRKAWDMKSQMGNKMGKSKTAKFWDQVYITTTLIAIVFFFFIGEIPIHLISKKTNITSMINGEYDGSFEKSPTMDVLREVTVVLCAIHISINFFLYCFLCPLFKRTMKNMLDHNKKILKSEACKKPLGTQDVSETETKEPKEKSGLRVVKIFIIGGQAANKWLASWLSTSSGKDDSTVPPLEDLDSDCDSSNEKSESGSSKV